MVAICLPTLAVVPPAKATVRTLEGMVRLAVSKRLTCWASIWAPFELVFVIIRTGLL